jgi:hypothetical protein
LSWTDGWNEDEAFSCLIIIKGGLAVCLLLCFPCYSRAEFSDFLNLLDIEGSFCLQFLLVMCNQSKRKTIPIRKMGTSFTLHYYNIHPHWIAENDLPPTHKIREQITNNSVEDRVCIFQPLQQDFRPKELNQ